MGCFSETCAFSAMPIDAGNRTVIVPTVATDGADPRLPWDFSGLPIRGEYNDYGFIEDVHASDPGLTVLSQGLGLDRNQALEALEENRNDGGFVLFSEVVWDAIGAEPPPGSRLPSPSEFSAALESVVKKPADADDIVAAVKSNPVLSLALPSLADGSSPDLASAIREACSKPGRGRVEMARSILSAARDAAAVREFFLLSGKTLACGASGPQSGAWAAHWFASMAVLSVACGAESMPEDEPSRGRAPSP